MTTYAVIRKLDQQEVYRYSADAPADWNEWPFATHDHVPEPASVTVVTDVPVVRMVWSQVAFMRRFKAPERIAIRQAATQNAQLDDLMRLLDASSEVYSDDPDVVAGLAMLEGAGLLAAGRAAEILA